MDEQTLRPTKLKANPIIPQIKPDSGMLGNLFKIKKAQKIQPPKPFKQTIGVGKK
jgi:hypothetical protein